MKLQNDRDCFLRGIGYAVARFVEMHDQPKMAGEVLKESGYAYGDFAEVCDEADLLSIKKAWNEVD